jgi:hypothetical protein
VDTDNGGWDEILARSDDEVDTPSSNPLRSCVSMTRMVGVDTPVAAMVGLLMLLDVEHWLAAALDVAERGIVQLMVMVTWWRSRFLVRRGRKVGRAADVESMPADLLLLGSANSSSRSLDENKAANSRSASADRGRVIPHPVHLSYILARRLLTCVFSRNPFFARRGTSLR